MKKVVFLVITGVATSLSVIAQTQTAVTDLIKLDVRQFDELSEYIPGMQMQLQSSEAIQRKTTPRHCAAPVIASRVAAWQSMFFSFPGLLRLRSQ
ncbi:MAG: hypothetical protein LBE71_03510 [Dysgonamonadaceae bacterium]|jgi:hypothetical protein|nr:hypothetical protein [Dysgonamonadaceae bacterium]